MLDAINARLQQAREHRDQCQSRRNRLPPLREELKREAYRLQSLEACLDEIQLRIDKLQSASFGALMASLLGRKDAQLAEYEAQLAELQEEFTACERAVVELDVQVKEVESDLGDVDAVEAEYQALLKQKEQLLVERGGESAQALSELLDQLSRARSYEVGLEKAVQVGKHLTERLHSMTRSVGRARTKGLASAAGGVLIAATVNTVMQGGTAKPAVERVVTGLEELHSAINGLEWSSEKPRDERVLQLAAGVAGFATDVQVRGASGMVWDASSVAPMLDAVQELVGHLKDIAAETSGQVKSLEAERQRVIEDA